LAEPPESAGDKKGFYTAPLMNILALNSKNQDDRRNDSQQASAVFKENAYDAGTFG